MNSLKLIGFRNTYLKLNLRSLAIHKIRPLSNALTEQRINDKSSLKNVEKTQLLLRSIESRINKLRNEVDLGIGPVIEENNDFLKESIIKATNLDHVKELIALNYREMSPQHVNQCYETIGNIIKYSEDSDKLKFDILSSKEFSLLANRTFKLSRHFEAAEALETMIIVRNLGISMDTFLMQSLLQVIRYSINDYSVADIHRIVHVFKVYKANESCQSTLISAIMLALPTALKHRINYKEMSFYSPQMLSKCLEIIAFFGCENFGDMEAINKCLYFINKMVSRYNLKESLRLLSHIYELNVSDPENSKLASLIISKCITNICNCDSEQLSELPAAFYVNALNRMKNNFSFYDRRLVEIICKHAITNQQNFKSEQLYTILLQNYNFKYVDHNLFRLFAKFIDDKNPDLFGPTSKISLSNIFRIFTVCNEPSIIHSDMTLLSKNIQQSFSFQDETLKSRMQYFYFIKNCLMLNANLDDNFVYDCFSKYFEHAVDESSIFSKRQLFLETMVKIYQGVTISQRDRIDPTLIQYISDKLRPVLTEFIELNQNKTSIGATNATLEQIYSIVLKLLNDNKIQVTKNYISDSGLMTDLFIETTDTFDFFSHKNDRSNIKKIGIILLTAKNYCREPHTFDGNLQFALNNIQKCNIKPVTIDTRQWQSLVDSERELFLLNKLKYIA